MSKQIPEVSSVGVTIFVLCAAAGALGTVLSNRPIPAVVGILVGVYFLFAIKVVRQWEKVAVLRFGRYRGLRSPGLTMIVPVVDSLSAYVDQRVRVTKVTAESALTRDTVPVTWTPSCSGWCGTPRSRFWRWRIFLTPSP